MGLKWVCYVQPGLVNHGPCSLHAHGDPNVSELKAWIVTMEFKLAQITQLLVKMSWGWGNHFQGSSRMESAHNSPPSEAEIGSQSGGQGSVVTGEL